MPQDARRRNTKWWVIGTLGVLAMSALAVWFGLAASADRVRWNDAGFQVVDDSRIDVRFDVYREPGRTVTCDLVAQNYDHLVVGSSTVQIPPSDKDGTREIIRIRTTSPAVAGVVRRCDYDDGD